MSRAVFLDRDGTVNRDTGYVCRADDIEWLPGAVEALRMLRAEGFLLIVVTNQSGIGRGLFSEEDYLRFEAWIETELEKEGAVIARTYHCPHHPEATVPRYRTACRCRKPGTELFERAVEDFGIDLSRSYCIGDRERDVSLCRSTQARGFVLYQERERSEGRIRFITGGLHEAAMEIVRESSFEIERGTPWKRG